MARVLEQFGMHGRMWHRNDDYPDDQVTAEMVRIGWVEDPTPVIEQATAAPGEKRATTRTRKAAAKKATKKAKG